MRNRIPLSRGLGSSAAATIGGLLAGNSLLGGPLSPAELLRLATEIEGHADNAAAALLGGFVVVDSSADPPTAIRFNVPRDLKVVLFIPELRLSTADDARGPAQEGAPRGRRRQPRPAWRSGWPGSPSGTYEHLGALTQDRLHEQYRAAVYPQFPALVQAARDAGAVGACLSGAGSSVIAFSDALATLSRIEGAFSAVAADLDVPGRVAIAAPRNAGPGRRERLMGGPPQSVGDVPRRRGPAPAHSSCDSDRWIRADPGRDLVAQAGIQAEGGVVVALGVDQAGGRAKGDPCPDRGQADRPAEAVALPGGMHRDRLELESQGDRIEPAQGERHEAAVRRNDELVEGRPVQGRAPGHLVPFGGQLRVAGRPAGPARPAPRRRPGRAFGR